ncbi:MAG: hypothetical protein ED555_04210 [Allomuricauda sp.]|nr:MAG: hypothetical protein ED555_04210 [Allomuricauda sp.]
MEKKVLLDSIPIPGQENEHYALYVPSTLDESVPFPALFVFDPAGRGVEGLKPFIASAEKYGIFLACSITSRNGSLNENFALAENLINHLLAQYSIDAEKLYLAGFSGSSRLVSAIACTTNSFAGVIGCGAGFTGSPQHVPSTQGFAYAGICGNQDMNYLEMFNNAAYLENINFSHSMFSFNGGHEWPPETVVLDAMDWLFIQPKKGANKVQLEAYTKALFKQASILEKNHEYLFAHEVYGRIASLPEKILQDSLDVRLENLNRNTVFKTSKIRFERALEEESKYRKKLFSRFNRDAKDPKRASLDWWEKELNKLTEMASKGDRNTKHMVARLRFSLYASAAEKTNPNLYKANAEQLAFFKLLKNSIYPSEN